MEHKESGWPGRNPHFGHPLRQKKPWPGSAGCQYGSGPDSDPRFRPGAEGLCGKSPKLDPGENSGYGTVKDQKTRWGSCSAKGNVNFNYQLAFLPDELLDYVVIHELAHRRHMNHSRAFWAEVEKYCPDYLERREQLKEYSL